MFTYTKAVKSHHLWTLYICSFHFLLLASTIKYNVRLDLKRFSTQVYKYWRYWLYCCYYAIFYVPAILSYFKHVKTLFKEKIIMILRKHSLCHVCIFQLILAVHKNHAIQENKSYNKVWCKYSFSRVGFLWIFMLKNHGVLCFHYLQIKKSSNYSTFV